MTSEFSLISQYFQRPTQHTDVGVGDDGALLTVSEGCQLVVSADMSVVNTHFFPDAKPYDIGWKSMAVNVSDMAAMGATPKWATLAIALPEVNADWLAGFSEGLFACADAFHVDLIGGDTTRGSLNIGIQIMGEVPTGQALTRAGAQEGDDVWVSGELGKAAMGLVVLQGDLLLEAPERTACLQALHHPEPRVDLGIALRDIATSCIDISDGLVADLTHIAKASNVGAEIQSDALPLLVKESAQYALSGGEDYELCFTAPANAREQINALAKTLNIPLSKIGHIIAGDSVKVLGSTFETMPLQQTGYDHFA